MNHVGRKVTIADPDTIGITSDHVEILLTMMDTPPYAIAYSVYARANYKVGSGPKPMPQDMSIYKNVGIEIGEKPRGWSKIETICQNVSLEEAKRLAEPEAQRRGVVLYLCNPARTILWHPDGWEPQEG